MGNEYLSFKKDSTEVQKLIDWWDDLEKNYRGERAVLRRCSTLNEVVLSPAYHRLRMALLNIGRVYDNQLSLVVGLTVRVKTNADESGIAGQMATGKTDGSARVSGLRFRRLLKVKERDELFTAMSRIIALLGRAVNIQSLAQSVYFWNDRTRKDWAFEYYSKAPDEK
jgi:CRISPR system Cascade subunit CasB